jgi:proteasome-associated ATPase
MHDRPAGRSEGSEDRERSAAELNRQIGFLEDEVALLRRKLTESPRHVRLLEERLADASARVTQLTERNAKLIDTLKDARNQLMALREEVDRLAQPPSGYGVFIDTHEDGTVDVFTARCGSPCRRPSRSRTSIGASPSGSTRR